MKSTSFLALTLFLLLLLLVEACKKDEYKNLDCSSIAASYSKDIQAIVAANCLTAGCHHSGSANGDFTGYAGLKGKANNGSLNKRVLEKKDMPNGTSLSLDDRKKIKCWLSNGAPQN